jgi:16S rRNA (uracil1498-N3)-methyltransferase
MAARFYAPDARAPGELVTLPEDEAAHLIRVLRLRAGEAVVVFDGRGHEFEAKVEQVDKTGARVRLVTLREPGANEPSIAVTLAQAVLKADKMDDVVRDAVMVGATAIQPVVTMRCEVALAAIERGGRRERWERIAVSSAKQCGRAVVPPVLRPTDFEALAAALGDRRLPGPAVMLVEPSVNADAVSISDLDGPPPRETTIIIGPEGGWTAEEIRQAASFCRLVTLGTRTIRADAMAVVALSALFAHWHEF